MSRGIAITMLAAVLAVGALLPAGAQTQSYEVRYQGQSVNFTNQPIAYGSTTLVPLRESLAAIGAQNVNFDQSTNQVSFTLNGQQGVLDLTNQQATMNGAAVPWPGVVQSVNGNTYVDARFLTGLDQNFQVTRSMVLGYRSAPGFPVPAGVNTFAFNGQTHTYAAPTFYMGGVLMVPVNETLSGMGVATIPSAPGIWQSSFTYGGHNIVLNATSGYAWVDNQAYVLPRPVVVRDNRMYVPAAFFAALDSRFTIAGMQQAPVVSTVQTVPPGTAVLGIRQEPGK